MSTRLTVIIPTLGRSTLPKVIEEIAFSNEVIIILLCHGASTFQNLKKLDLKPEIQVIECSEKLSISDLCNEGLARVETQYFAFFSDDDTWLPQKSQLLMSFLDLNPEIDIVFGATLEVNGKGKKIRPTDLLRDNQNIFAYLYEVPIIFSNNRYLGLQDAILRNGNYPLFRQGISVYEDIIWLADAQKMGHKVHAISDLVSVKYPSLTRSSSRQGPESANFMFKQIKDINGAGAKNYLRFHAVRASIGSGKVNQYFKLLKLRTAVIGVNWRDIYLIPIQLCQLVYFKSTNATVHQSQQ